MLVLELAPTAYFDILCLLYLSLLYLLIFIGYIKSDLVREDL